jgi:hypothetical protein
MVTNTTSRNYADTTRTTAQWSGKLAGDLKNEQIYFRELIDVRGTNQPGRRQLAQA